MGILAALASAVFSTCKDLVSKKLTLHIDGIASTFASFAFALPFYLVVLAILWACGYDIFHFSVTFWWLVLARALTDVFAEGLKMYSFAHGDVGFLTIIFSLSPLMVVAVSPVLDLGELSIGGAVAVTVVVIGSLALVYQPSHPDWARQKKALILGIAASICFTLNSIFDSMAMRLARAEGHVEQAHNPGAATMAGFTMTAVSAAALLPFVLTSRVRLLGIAVSSRPLLTRGALETAFMVCKLVAMQWLAAAYVVGLQRASLLLSIVAGRLVFKEGDFKRRMLAGLLILLGVAWIVWEQTQSSTPPGGSEPVTGSTTP